MSAQSNVCACGICIGTQCTCGCQNPASRLTASCRCGEKCSCTETCTCKACQNARLSENR